MGNHDYKQFHKGVTDDDITESPSGKDVILTEDAPKINTGTKNKPVSKNAPEGEVINCTQLNVRSGPEFASNVLCVVDAGTILTLTDFTDEWAHVTTPDGIEGFVMEEFIKY